MLRRRSSRDAPKRPAIKTSQRSKRRDQNVTTACWIVTLMSRWTKPASCSALSSGIPWPASCQRAARALQMGTLKVSMIHKGDEACDTLDHIFRYLLLTIHHYRQGTMRRIGAPRTCRTVRGSRRPDAGRRTVRLGPSMPVTST